MGKLLAEGDAAWLLEDGGKRLKKLELLSGAALVNAKLDELKLTVKFDVTHTFYKQEREMKDWADECLRAMLALRSGGSITVGTRDPVDRTTVVNVPRECKSDVLGTSGARLLELSEKLGVVAVFAEGKDELHIYGEDERGRKEMEVKVLNMIQPK